jgi:hypothetical protein
MTDIVNFMPSEIVRSCIPETVRVKELESLIQKSPTLHYDYLDLISRPTYKWIKGGYIQGRDYMVIKMEDVYVEVYRDDCVYYPHITFEEYVRQRFMGLI